MNKHLLHNVQHGQPCFPLYSTSVLIRGGLQVYESLARSGEVPPEELAYFDPEGGEDLLYGMRFLPIAARPPIARFIVERKMDGPVRPPSCSDTSMPALGVTLLVLR